MKSKPYPSRSLSVLGVLQRDDELGTAERHLGLMPSKEAEVCYSFLGVWYLDALASKGTHASESKV